MTHVSTYALVTEAPHAGENFSVPIGLHDVTKLPSETNGYLGSFRPVPFEVVVGLRMPVFHRGEILLLDDNDQEIGGQRRKPNVWGVTLERFDTLEQVLQRYAMRKHQWGSADTRVLCDGSCGDPEPHGLHTEPLGG